jgi:probable addiction module antidote protein
MPKRTKSYETDLHERLRDPAYAMEYLRAALEDDEEGADAVFLLALRDVAQASHMTYVAEAAGLNRESLYKMLSRRGNPGLNSLKAVLNAVGLKLSVDVAPERSQALYSAASWEPQEEYADQYLEIAHRDPEYPDQGQPEFCPVGTGLKYLANPPPLAAGNADGRRALPFSVM